MPQRPYSFIEMEVQIHSKEEKKQNGDFWLTNNRLLRASQTPICRLNGNACRRADAIFVSLLDVPRR